MLIQKLSLCLKMILYYKNWGVCILDYLRFFPKKVKVLELRNKLKFYARLRTTDLGVINGVFLVNTYARAFHNLPKNPIIVDVGAHIGTFSLFAFQKYPHATIYSYEPFYGSFSLLQKNIILNNCKNIKAFNIGVADKKKKRKFFIFENDPSSNSMISSQQADGTVEINCIPLREVMVGIRRCDLLKLDCEAAEHEILFTSKNVLKKINRIILDYHVPQYFNLPLENTSEKLMNYLQENGFQCSYTQDTHFSGIIYAEKVKS